ncbi:MAG: IclR family transcriptional regulator [Burkholderiaceae bacterium]
MPAFVPAAARTLSILEAFAREQRELSNSEVAALLDIADSSSSDLLHTLHELGYVMRTARSRRFYPTQRLISVARAIAEHDPVDIAIREAIELLSRRTGETALCGRLDGHKVNVVGIQEGSYALRYIQRTGTRVAVHLSSLGRALLAILPEDEAMSLLDGRLLRSVTTSESGDIDILRTKIAQARTDGYAWVDGEGMPGVAGISVAGMIGPEPIAIALAGPAERFRAHREEYCRQLLEIRSLVFGPESPGVRSRKPRRRRHLVRVA